MPFDQAGHTTAFAMSPDSTRRSWSDGRQRECDLFEEVQLALRHDEGFRDGRVFGVAWPPSGTGASADCAARPMSLAAGAGLYDES